MARIILVHDYPNSVEGVHHRDRALALRIEQAVLDQEHSYLPLSSARAQENSVSGADYDALVWFPGPQVNNGNVVAGRLQETFPALPVVVVLLEGQTALADRTHAVSVVMEKEFDPKSKQTSTDFESLLKRALESVLAGRNPVRPGLFDSRPALPSSVLG